MPVTVVRFDAAAGGTRPRGWRTGGWTATAGPPNREIVPCELVARGSGELAPA